MTDQELLTAYEEARAGLRRTIAHIVGDTDADDVLQNTIMRAWQGRETFRGAAKITTWLYRIAYNTSLMHLRRRYLKVEVELDLSVMDCVDLRAMPLQRLLMAEVVDQTLQQVQRCSSRENVDRFLAYIFSEKPAKEVAGELGITTPALKASIHRVQVAMRELR